MKILNVTIAVKKIPGKGRGEKMGIATINFHIPRDLSVEYGIYAGRLTVGHQKYSVAIHFGPRPQFHEDDPSLEAYVLDGKIADIRDNMTLTFTSFIRKITSFENIEEMLKQIDKDVKQIRQILE